MDRQCPSCGGFCKKSGCERENVKPEDVWQRAMENALVYGTGFVRFDSMGGISVVDPKDYHYLEKKEWLGLTDEEIKVLPSWWPSYEQMPALMTLARDIENSLKEKNT